jgi:hypothetical protein
MSIDTELNMINSTFKRTSPMIADAVMDNVALYKWLESKGKVQKLSGGLKVTEQLIISENSNFAWQAPESATTAARVDMLNSAEYDWKYLYGNIVVTGAELRNNSAPHDFQRLLKALIIGAESTMTNLLDEGLFNNTSTGIALSLVGLPEQITADGTGTVGGIATTSYDNWKNQFVASSLTLTAATSAEFLAAMTEMYNKTTFGSKQTDLIISDATFRAKYEASCQEQKRFVTANAKAADLGFQAYDFNGAAFIFDPNCPANTAYFLNCDYINFYVHKDANMKLTGKAKSEGNDKYLWMMLLQCALTLSSRKHQGVLTFTAAS